ncbi:hypothetical protein D9M70_399200 [compost metagenome]
MPPTKATSPSIATSLRCMRRKICVRTPSRRRRGENVQKCTPALTSSVMNAGGRSCEPKPSTVTATRTPRRAAASSAACNFVPASSSNRIKVSTSTLSRARAIASKTRGKYSSPFSSRRMLSGADGNGVMAREAPQTPCQRRGVAGAPEPLSQGRAVGGPPGPSAAPRPAAPPCPRRPVSAAACRDWAADPPAVPARASRRR